MGLRAGAITPQVSIAMELWPQTIFTDAWTEAVSPLQITEADKDQTMFQEVDLGEMKSRSRHHRSADKENVPPPSSNRGLKRLAIPPNTNESNASTHRVPKVSVMWNVYVVSWFMSLLLL